MKKKLRALVSLFLVLMLVGTMTTAFAARTGDMVYSQDKTEISSQTGGDVKFSIAFPANTPYSSAMVGFDFTGLINAGASIKSFSANFLPDEWSCFKAYCYENNAMPVTVAATDGKSFTYNENKTIMEVTVSIPAGMTPGTYGIYMAPKADAYDTVSKPYYILDENVEKVLELKVTAGAGTYYTVTYDPAGGTVANTSVSVLQGSSTTLPTATKPYYDLDYWKNPSGVSVGKANSSYTPTASVTLTAVWKDKALREAPVVTPVAASTETASDGKITGTDTTMEYSTNQSTWTKCTGAQITGLKPGTYYVRYAETSTERAGKTATVKVGFGKISVTGVKLNKNTLSLTVGGSETLIATVTPENAANKAVTWSSSNERVATVNQSGKVTAVSEGTAVITVTTVDGGKTDTCTVTVTKKNGGSEGGGTVDPSKPQLNRENHFAYIVGYPNGTVKPDANITRAEVATIFFRLLTEESRTRFLTKTNSFTDVNSNDWFNAAVSTLANAGILQGKGDKFRPNDPITRAELAVIATRFDEFTGTQGSGASFTDTCGHWAEKEIAHAASVGWVKGYTDGSFKPDQKITRAEAMALINRVLERAVEPANMLGNMNEWSDNALNKWYYADVQEATNSHEYVRTEKKVDGYDFCYESWTKINTNPDWSALEK